MFSALEVANFCGVVNQTAINWIKSGHLKAFTTPGGQYRVNAPDLVVFLETCGMRVPPELAPLAQQTPAWNVILIVDDDRQLNDMLKRWLERSFAEYSIYQAYDGFEAGALLSDKRPGFVLLDIGLPGLDGRALCRRIKESPEFGNPFIIAISGLEREEASQSMLGQGADAFFEKPLDLEAMGAALKEFAEKVRTRNG